jgi:hypothetical protein
MPLTPTRTMGAFGYAMAFNGGDYVEVQHSDVLTWDTSNFTVCIRLSFFSRSDSYAGVFNKGRWGEAGWALSSEKDLSGFAFVNHFMQRKYYTSTQTALLRYRVVHLAFVRRGTEWLWFIDSTVNASGSLTDFKKDTYSLTIMGEPHINRWVGGRVYDIHIYNNDLTPEEIKQIYYNPLNPTKDGLVLWFVAYPSYVRDVDGDGVLEWVDLSGYGNHGKIYGARLVELVKAPVRVLARAR